MKKLQQATQARDKAIDAVVDSIEIPLPEKFVEHELTHARENIDNQLAQMNMSKEDYLKTLEKTEEEFDADLVEQSQRSVRVSFVLDEVARSENLSVNQAELSYFVADQAQRMGISPEYFARQLTESGQVGVAITEVLRGKAATLTAERVTVTDDKGETIDVKAEIEGLNADVDAMLAAQAAAAEAEADIEVEDLAIDVPPPSRTRTRPRSFSRLSPRPRPRPRSSTRPRPSSRKRKPTRTRMTSTTKTKRTTKTTRTKSSPDLR